MNRRQRKISNVKARKPPASIALRLTAIELRLAQIEIKLAGPQCRSDRRVRIVRHTVRRLGLPR